MALMIFDLDGTLVDSRNSILGSIRYALKKIGLVGLPIDEQKATQQDLATTLRQAFERAQMNFEEGVVGEFIQSYRFHNSQDPEKNIRIFDGVREVLASIRDHFYLAVATTKDSQQAQHILKHLGLADFFQHIQGTDSGMRYKPAPDILFKTLRTLEVPSSKALYVGDSAHDMRAAGQGGLRKMAALYGFGDRSELTEEQPHWMLERFDELISLRYEVHHQLMN